METKEQQTRRRRVEHPYMVERATCRHCGQDIVRISAAPMTWRHTLKVPGRPGEPDRERFGREQCATTYASPTEETP